MSASRRRIEAGGAVGQKRIERVERGRESEVNLVLDPRAPPVTACDRRSILAHVAATSAAAGKASAVASDGNPEDADLEPAGAPIRRTAAP